MDARQARVVRAALHLPQGLNKVRLTKAHFIWTEPHSKRLRVWMTIQKEGRAAGADKHDPGADVRARVPRAARAVPGPCEARRKEYLGSTHASAPKVQHKRTFLFLERRTLKHGAVKMVEFPSSVVPVRSKVSEQLLSSDTDTDTDNYKSKSPGAPGCSRATGLTVDLSSKDLEGNSEPHQLGGERSCSDKLGDWDQACRTGALRRLWHAPLTENERSPITGRLASLGTGTTMIALRWPGLSIGLLDQPAWNQYSELEKSITDVKKQPEGTSRSKSLGTRHQYMLRVVLTPSSAVDHPHQENSSQ
ncbi:hypothetical protein DFH09DRAFT_1097372 [Mycena vulgaris]|nr:hypothetical protein DFH09DRAFT_1097372 [Mycena vulgaris]